MVLKVGILSLQGAFSKHEDMLKKIGIETLQVRYPEELSQCRALVIPGGESTVMQWHLHQRGLIEPLKQFALTRPLFGTCAGMILMAKGGILNLMDITVNRNAYGRQAASFSASLPLTFSNHTVDALFIRAPRIASIHSNQVLCLARLNEEPVLVQQGHHLAASFHPELTNNPVIHQYFLKLVQ